MRKIPTIFVLIIISSLFGGLADASQLKVGYIDTARLLKEAPQSEAARKKLKDEFNPRDQKIVNMQNELKHLNEMQDRKSTNMSKSESIQIERQVIALKRDIKRAREEFNEDFNIRRNEELTKLHKLINKETENVAKEYEYDIILSDNVLYNSKRVDITNLVLKRLQILNSTSSKRTATE